MCKSNCSIPLEKQEEEGCRGRYLPHPIPKTHQHSSWCAERHTWPLASPGTPCDPQERQEAKPRFSSTSFPHRTILPAHSMASVTPSSSSSGCSPLENFLSKLLVTPSGRGFPPLLSIFKVSVSFPDLPQSGYGSPQSLLCWQPFAMFYLFCCCKTKCFSYFCPLVMGMFQIHR